MLAGYADLDITPAPGEELTGYGYFLNRRAEGTLDPLMARAVALGDGECCVVVVQLDLLGLSKPFVESVRAEAHETLGLPPECLLLHCTHTHSGPATVHVTGCGTPSESFLPALRGQILRVVKAALSDLRPAARTRKFVGGFTEGFAHNRVGGSDLDTRVRGLQVELAGGQPILLFSYACHPVTLGVNRLYSADYPGYAIQELNAYGIRALFLNGCCGDVDPLSNAYRWGGGTQDTLRIYGRDLARAVRRALETAEPWTPGPLRARSRLLPLEMSMPDPEEMQKARQALEATLQTDPDAADARVEATWLDAMLRLCREGGLWEAMQAEVQAIACGDAGIAGLSGEVFTRLGRMVREGAPNHHLLVAATCNGVLGYIATREDVEARSYASHRACQIYGMPLPAPGAGEKWAEAGARLVAETVG